MASSIWQVLPARHEAGRAMRTVECTCRCWEQGRGEAAGRRGRRDGEGARGRQNHHVRVSHGREARHTPRDRNTTTRCDATLVETRDMLLNDTRRLGPEKKDVRGRRALCGVGGRAGGEMSPAR